MSRLIDCILAGDVRPSMPGVTKWADLPPSKVLEGSTAIFVDNVVQFMFEGTEQEEWFPSDFPNLAPAFESMWIESKFPRVINSRGEMVPVNPSLPSAFGALIIAVDETERSRWQWRWVLNCIPFERHGNRAIGPLGMTMLRVKSDGAWIEEGDKGSSCALYGLDGLPPERQQKVRDIVWWRVKPLLLGLSFLNCKNVKRTREEPSPALSKKWERRHGRPLVKGYVLDVQPMRQVLKSEGGQDAHGLKKALHICRGHFKTYGERPLFGKHRGTYWWDSSARGSIESGVVAKDYNVLPPPSAGEGSGS